MTAVTIDHEALGLSRVALQYQASARFRAFLLALLAQPADIEAALDGVAAVADIDLAEGVNLDAIGDIVGVSRVVPGVIQVGFFGFADTLAALPFGEEGNASTGGRFRDEDESETDTSVLADPEYRLLIRARIVRNHARGTNEDILAALSYVFGGVPCVVEDVGGMAIGIAIGRPVTLMEVALMNLDILPRPAGVRIAWRGYYDASSYLGFEGQPGAQPFAEEGATTGPQLLEEF
jgi:Protein of unknown function (DUF2612)